MSVQDDVNAMRSDLSGVSDPATFLDDVLSTTGQTLSTGDKKIVVVTYTREQIMLRFATQSNLS